MFAVFLLCSLLPLGSSAPAVTSEGKITTEQKHFTTEIKPLASVLEMQATDLFKSYNACSAVTPQTVSWLMASPQARELVRAIPECPAFDAACCAFPVFYDHLKALRSDVEAICGKAAAGFVDANLRQLEVVLGERAELYACCGGDLAQAGAVRSQQMKTAEKTTVIWRLLQKYEQFMQNTTKLYSSTDM